MTPFGDQPEAPDASALLECYTRAGMIHWTLNVTDVEGFSKAKLVYGNPDITAIDGEHLQSGHRSHLLLRPRSQVSRRRFRYRSFIKGDVAQLALLQW